MSLLDKLAIVFSIISIIFGIITAYKNHQFVKDRKEFEKSTREHIKKYGIRVPSKRTIIYLQPDGNQNEKLH